MNTPTSRLALLALLAGSALPALAQYKVVRPDGSVTYTDRPPAEANVRVTALGRNTAAVAGAAENQLPLELRQAGRATPSRSTPAPTARPATAAAGCCSQRGIPYAERRIGTEEDAQALERAVGGRSVPALNIGAQPVRGYSEGDWTSYLDAAGYPKENKLPRNWPVATPTPLVERATPTVAPARAAAPAPAAEPEAPQPSTGIRF